MNFMKIVKSLLMKRNEIVSEISTTLDAEENNKSELSNKELTTLAIATDIDALAIGVSFAFLNVKIHYFHH